MNISVYILIPIIAITMLVLLVIVVGRRGKRIPINKTSFAMGLIIVGAAVGLLLMDVIESGIAALIGIVGIGLIAASGSSNMKRIR